MVIEIQTNCNIIAPGTGFAETKAKALESRSEVGRRQRWEGKVGEWLGADKDGKERWENGWVQTKMGRNGEGVAGRRQRQEG